VLVIPNTSKYYQNLKIADKIKLLIKIKQSQVFTLTNVRLILFNKLWKCEIKKENESFSDEQIKTS
jgi:hypothetical protein